MLFISQISYCFPSSHFRSYFFSTFFVVVVVVCSLPGEIRIVMSIGLSRVLQWDRFVVCANRIWVTQLKMLVGSDHPQGTDFHHDPISKFGAKKK